LFGTVVPKPVVSDRRNNGMATAGIEPVYPNSIAVVAIAPIGGDTPIPLGFVRIGYYLDRRFISSVRALSHTDLAIEYRGAIIAATVKVDAASPRFPKRSQQNICLISCRSQAAEEQ